MPTRGSEGKLLSCPVCMLQCLAGSLSLLAMPGAEKALLTVRRRICGTLWHADEGQIRFTS